MKRVLFIATVTRHIIEFHIPYLKWFKEQGYEVHVASNGNEKIEYCDKHFELPFARFPLKKENFKAYKQLKKIINENEYKIIHCHTPVGGVLARLAARNVRKKETRVIYTAHGFHFYKGAPLLNWLIYYPIEKIMAKYTDCLITINNEDYEFAKKHLKAKKIELVNGVGVDEEKFNIKMTEEEKEKFRKTLGLNKESFIISYIAELNKNKNQIMILNSIKDLIIKENKSNIHLLLIGNGNDKDMLQSKAKEYAISENVHFLGYRRDIPQLLKITDLYVSVSQREGLPVNLIEATFANLPIIATNCRGNRDIAKVLVEINDVESMKNEIKKYIETGKTNIQYEKEKYELKEIRNKMKNIYENIVTQTN